MDVKDEIILHVENGSLVCYGQDSGAANHAT